MWHEPPQTLFVFGGPSLDPPLPSSPSLVRRPPVVRGDLDRLIDTHRPSICVLIDGLFGQSLAVTATECRRALDRGWTIIGASSMGALRAAELWSVGMIGVGEVYGLMRAGVILRDDEVAVAYDPSTYREVTGSLVHLRGLLRELDAPASARRRAFEIAGTIHWMERTWGRLRLAWRDGSVPRDVVEGVLARRHDPELHPKVRDARAALRLAECLVHPWGQHEQTKGAAS